MLQQAWKPVKWTCTFCGNCFVEVKIGPCGQMDFFGTFFVFSFYKQPRMTHEGIKLASSTVCDIWMGKVFFLYLWKISVRFQHSYSSYAWVRSWGSDVHAEDCTLCSIAAVQFKNTDRIRTPLTRCCCSSYGWFAALTCILCTCVSLMG